LLAQLHENDSIIRKTQFLEQFRFKLSLLHFLDLFMDRMKKNSGNIPLTKAWKDNLNKQIRETCQVQNNVRKK